MKTTTPELRNSINHSLVRAFLLIAPTLGWLALSPQARAVCQEGCLTNQNTVLREDALLNNTGPGNTAIGFNALYSNTMGVSNTANGNQALYSNTTGISNTAIGSRALFNNTTGDYNTANGIAGLLSNTTGFSNTANGISALSSNTTGSFNTANGVFALYYNTTGNSNIPLGFEAGMNITGNSNIDIGNVGVAGESRTIRVGTKQTHRTTFVAGISGATVPTGVAVIVDANGHLGTTTSSARLKEAIKPMDKASEAILALKPVIFHLQERA